MIAVEFDGARVLVKFDVSKDVHLGDRKARPQSRQEACSGVKGMGLITTRGDGDLRDAIPMDRTTPAYQSAAE